MLRNLKQRIGAERRRVFPRASVRGPAAQRHPRLAFEALEPRRVLDVGPLQITEFMALNDSVLQDEDGSYSDWIEIHNPSDAEVSLDGWYLTDRADDLTKWQFPAVALGADEYMVVFASNKDRTDPQSELHTNFALAGGGEYLALVHPNGVAISHDYAPEFPQQSHDVSYGLWGQRESYFHQPTPGAPNEMADTIRITEFMAANDGVLLDGDGFASDWIEVYNPTPDAVVLDGWYLTDRADNFTKWQFPDMDPDTTLQPGAYLVVFASGGRENVDPPPADPNVDPEGNLHTSFALNADPENLEYLALVEPDGETVSHAYTPTYPQQSEGVSYGLLEYQEQCFVHPTRGSRTSPTPWRTPPTPSLVSSVASMRATEEQAFRWS